MAYNHQQVPFWDFIRSFDPNGAGVDHTAGGPPQSSFSQHGGFGAFGAGFPFGGPGSHEFGGRGRWGGWGRGGRRGRGYHRSGSHDHEHEHEDEHEHQHGSREASPNRERSGDEAREGSPHFDEEGHRHGHGRRGCHGHRGRRGGRGGWGEHGGSRGWGRGGQRGPPPFGGPGAFDISGLIESLSAHPIAQAFRSYAEQAAGQQSRSDDVADNDTENTFMPPVDVFSTPSAYILHVALPGAKKEDVGVNWDAEKGVLNLAGVVYRQGDEDFLKTLSQVERKVGVFERTVKLPPGTEEKEEVDGDAITAKLEDGVLVVNVPKVEKEWTEVKRVDIE